MSDATRTREPRLDDSATRQRSRRDARPRLVTALGSIRRTLGAGWRAIPADRMAAPWRRWSSLQRWRRQRSVDEPLRLHIGCGHERLDGWCNIDLLPLPSVDVCLDVTHGLPFEGATRIFAEHFLEHLHVDDAVDFLVACHGAMADGGWLRLSTPNLDWVYKHLYDGELAGDRTDRALHLNRAFYGWAHRFLWNRSALGEALRSTGFDSIRWCAWGESEVPEFHGLERHPRDPDSVEVPHVLIVEALKGPARPAELAALRGRLQEEFLKCRL